MKPTLLSQEYAGTDSEFTKVAFPPPSQDCIDAKRMADKEKCLPVRDYGNPEAVCDDPPFQLQKATSTSIRKLLVDGVPEDIQSPSYAVLKAYALPQMELSKFLEDLKGYEDPRLAVCDWVTKNMETLEKFIPPTYPRVQQERDEKTLLYSTLSLGAIAVILVIWTAQKVYWNRKKSIIRLAQVEFLALVLVGSLLTAIGAIIGGLPRISNATCVAEIWFVYLGYTLALVPQIVKVAAINRLMSAARRYQRLQLNLKHLYGAVTLVSLVVVIYLILWTALDPPLSRTHYTLTDSMTASGETIVLTSHSCGSQMEIWELGAFTWNGLLLVSGVVLAIQSRNVVQEFNESQTLGILIYTNFVFFMSRGLTFYLETVLNPSAILRYRSIIYALDVIGSLAVYFWPKLLLSNKKSNRNGRATSSMRGASVGGLSFESDFGSSHFFGASKPKGPTLTSLPNNRFVRLLTNTSHITFHPNEEDSVSFKEDHENDDKTRESTKVDQDTERDGADFSGEATLKSDSENYVRRLESTIVVLEAEVKCLRKRITGVSTHVGTDPPSPVSSTLESNKGAMKLCQTEMFLDEDISQQVRQQGVDRSFDRSEKLPVPITTSSSSETVSLSEQQIHSSSGNDKMTSLDQESTAYSMPSLTSYYSESESVRDSEVSVSENESFTPPIVQSPGPAVAPAIHATALISLISESDGEVQVPLREQSGIQLPSMAPPIPQRRPSWPSESLLKREESLLCDVSIFSITEQEENC